MQVEGEYLENIIIRIRQGRSLYPAVGIGYEQSYLRKIDHRLNYSAVIVWNIVKHEEQVLKLGVGYNYQVTTYNRGAFVPELNGVDPYFDNVSQLYARVKGEHNFLTHLELKYDVFYQVAMNDFSDNRWTILGTLNYAITKKIGLVATYVASFENFVATKVSNNNFRLTYGLKLKF